MRWVSDYRSAGQGSEAMMKKRGVTGGSTMNVASTVTADYQPSDEEPFMNDRQKEYFRQKLQEWKDSILDQSRGTVATRVGW